MITFETQSGSTYEVDDEKKRARRVVAGLYDTVRATDVWRDFEDRTSIAVGESVVFQWTQATEPLYGSPRDCLRVTVTSRVTKVQP